MPTPSSAFAQVLETLDKLEVPYLLGGSAASSIHGIARPTMDADLVVDLKADQVDEFVRLVEKDFYAHPQMMREALQRGRSFNLIHYATSFKIDLFPLLPDEYSHESFGRRSWVQCRSFGPEPIECAVASAEDVMLRKLEWYRAGGEASERQWADLNGILSVNGAELDRNYLRRWAKFLKVEDLLERLLQENGLGA